MRLGPRKAIWLSRLSQEKPEYSPTTRYVIAGDPVDSVQDCGYCIRLHPWHQSSLLHLHHSGQHLQSSKTPFGPSRWHVRPANRDTARPTKLPCCCSNCLEQSSSSFALVIHQSRTFKSWVKNQSLQSSLHQPMRTICYYHISFVCWSTCYL